MEEVVQAMSMICGSEVREDLIVKLPVDDTNHESYDVYVARIKDFILIGYIFQDGSITVQMV